MSEESSVHHRYLYQMIHLMIKIVMILLLCCGCIEKSYAIANSFIAVVLMWVMQKLELFQPQMKGRLEFNNDTVMVNGF